MGEFRFRMPSDFELPSHLAATVYVIGLDGIPWPCRIQREADSFVVSRNREESGRVYLSYPLPRYGRLILCTGSLPAGEKQFDLLIELARGTLNRIRNQTSIWEEGGLTILSSVREAVADATRLFGSALMDTDVGRRDQMAAEAIEKTVDAIFELSRSFGSQVSTYRRDHPELDDFWVVRAVSDDTASVAAVSDKRFDRVRLKPEQLGDVQVDESKNELVVGPFLDASAGGMDPALIRADDFHARRQRLLNGVRSHLSELPDTVSLLHLVSGLNGIGHRHLNYSQQLQVTMDMLNLIDETGVTTPTMVSFDFPWAERLAGAVGGIHPLQVADSLLRQGVQLTYVGLDMNLNYGPTGSAFRDPLQWIDLVDVWAQLGLPLVLCLRMPSAIPSPAGDEQATDKSAMEFGYGADDQQRFEILNTVLPMMAARPSVHGLIWQQWSDKDDPRFPFGGLTDSDGNEKPVLKVLECLRAWI